MQSNFQPQFQQQSNQNSMNPNFNNTSSDDQSSPNKKIPNPQNYKIVKCKNFDRGKKFK